MPGVILFFGIPAFSHQNVESSAQNGCRFLNVTQINCHNLLILCDALTISTEKMILGWKQEAPSGLYV